MTGLLLLLYHLRRLACSRWALLVEALCLAIVVWVSPLGAQLPRLQDGFEDRTQWQAGASDGVRAALRAVEGRVGQALCLDFDVAGQRCQAPCLNFGIWYTNARFCQELYRTFIYAASRKT